jgi:hypothetical protein
MNPNLLTAQTMAGRTNRPRRTCLTEQGRKALRAAALLHRPWTHSTGPKTAAGRAQSVVNGKRRQKGPFSVRELRRQVADVTEMIHSLKQSRKAAFRARINTHRTDLMDGSAASNHATAQSADPSPMEAAK